VKNLLMEAVSYKVEKTRSGTWRKFLYPTGAYFAEYRSDRHMFGLPLVHYTRGICPETGKRIVARGVIAVGRLAVGGVAVGHASMGLLAIGQLGVGLLFGLGQAATGLFSLGQLALALVFGLGQIATGWVAAGQFGVGGYVLAQAGFGLHVWSQGRADPEAVYFFESFFRTIGFFS